MTSLVFAYALRLGDDALILGQRLAEWTGQAPALEVDLSLANMGLDLLGQASSFLSHAAASEGAGRDADKLAFHRDVLDFTNCLIVEQPNGDFAQTIARQFLFSNFQLLFLIELEKSSDGTLAAIAAKAAKEVRYHAELASEWVVRLGDGSAESHQRMSDGIDWMWRFVDELFQMDELDQALCATGIAVDRSALKPEFDRLIQDVLSEATLQRPSVVRSVSGGRRGSHSEHLGHVLAVMQHLPRMYPDATW